MRGHFETGVVVMIIRFPDAALGGVYAVGVDVQHSPHVFELNFLMNDPADPESLVLVQRVNLAPSAVRQLINALNAQWLELDMDHGVDEPPTTPS